MAKHINELIASRRALLGGFVGLPLLNLAGCAAPGQEIASTASDALSFTSVPATNADTVTVPPGYNVRTLIGWGDALVDGLTPFDPDTLTRAEQEQRFGMHADMLALFPREYAFPWPTDQDRMILCANNEYANLELMFPAVTRAEDVTRAQVEAAIASIGATVVALERIGGEWRVVRDSAPGAGLNHRITPFTPMLFSGSAAAHPWIAAGAAAFNASEPARGPEPEGAVRCGTCANCAGGLTPWGTYLTSEENFDFLFIGSDENAAALTEAKREGAFARDCESFELPRRNFYADRWPAHFDMAHNPYGPALYGWIVEIDPYDPSWTPRKRTALGRKKGECATTALTRDSRVAVYTGDDQTNEFLYKFVTSDRFDPANPRANRDLLDHGQLYVARFHEGGGGEWLAITLANANSAAEGKSWPDRFRDEADLMVRVREAARLMDATPMDRPEDVEALQDAHWMGLGPVLVACTENRSETTGTPGNPRRESPHGPDHPQANNAGHVLRLDEHDNDCGATRFRWDVFALAGDPNASALVQTNGGREEHISTALNGVQTFTGDRFARPDNLFIDTRFNVWIATDGSDNVFRDCNDCVIATPAQAPAPRPMKRFLVGPVGAEICGPLMAPDERAFFAAIQHPGENDVAGVDFRRARWNGAAVPSHFPDGGDSWPRSTVVVVTRDDGGKIGT